MSQTTSVSSRLLSSETMAKLERMELVTRKVFRGRMKGERRSKRRGQSVEFADYRNYVPGDDLRFIDWNLFARLDRLYLKLFLEEEDLHLYTVIDDSLSMSFGDPSKFWVAKQIAACLGYIGLCHGDRVSISTFSTTHAPLVIRGKSSVHRLLSMLESSQVQPQSADGSRKTVAENQADHRSMRQAMKSFCLRNQGKGIVVVITDLLDRDGYESALRMLVAREMDVIVVHLLSPEELSPNLEGDIRLTDCEDRESVDVSVSAPMLERYHATLNEFLTQAKTFCSRLSINYVPARSDQSAELLVNEYLRARGLVR